ncbi:hypothetical protein OG943_12365 [Amycolatopsis sp. NBC_00345]|uniref:hypothetical protein n=1 Tax=Amycolatopsis sp. NBC_00345 TaxID=2975955 RepID=UPI002E25D044
MLTILELDGRISELTHHYPGRARPIRWPGTKASDLTLTDGTLLPALRLDRFRSSTSPVISPGSAPRVDVVAAQRPAASDGVRAAPIRPDGARSPCHRNGRRPPRLVTG